MIHITHGAFKDIEYLYIIPHPECITRFIDCARGPGRGKTPDFGLLNAEFVSLFDYDSPNRNWFRDAMFGESFENIKNSHLLCIVRAVREIDSGEEIFVDYGRKYWDKSLDSDTSDSEGNEENIKHES